MNDKEYGDFIFNMINTLQKNGFPEKKVALPLEKMYEIAHQKGLNFNRVLEFLEEKNICHEKTTEKIIFFESPNDVQESSSVDEKKEGQPNPFQNFNMDMLKNVNMSDMMKKASEMLKTMSPDELQKMQKMYADLSPEDREEMMKKAKEMGLF